MMTISAGRSGGAPASHLAVGVAALLPRVLLAGCLALCGCAGAGGGRAGAAAEEADYPDWVRMVPVSDDETFYYVGSCASASTPEEGVECAKEDAFSVLLPAARERLRKLFDRALIESRVETTSMERHTFVSDASEDYKARVAEAVTVDEEFHRPCLESGDKPWACEIFVLVSLEKEADERELAAVLDRYGRSFREQGRRDLAEVLEQMLRKLSE